MGCVCTALMPTHTATTTYFTWHEELKTHAGHFLSFIQFKHKQFDIFMILPEIYGKVIAYYLILFFKLDSKC